jgi:hypothetical protein
VSDIEDRAWAMVLVAVVIGIGLGAMFIGS